MDIQKVNKHFGRTTVYATNVFAVYPVFIPKQVLNAQAHFLMGLVALWSLNK